MKKVVLTAVLAGLAFPAIALADNTTCAAATLIVPDGNLHEGFFGAANEHRWFRFATRADRSYAVMMENMSAPDWAPLINMSSVFPDCASSALPAGTSLSLPWNGEPISSDDGFTGAGRWTLMTASAFTARFDLIGSAAGQQYSVRVEDTTQINTFFSTYSGFNTFYRFTNTINLTLTVRLKMVNDAGVTVVNTSFNILAGRSAPTRNTTASDLNVPANTGGFAIITHSGPPNALAADGFLMQGTTVLPIKIVDARQRR
jgi:hypothetical protein